MALIYDGNTFHSLNDDDYVSFKKFTEREEFIYYLEYRGLLDFSFDTIRKQNFIGAYEDFSAQFDHTFKRYLKQAKEMSSIEKRYDINVLFTRQYVIPEIENLDECNKFKENRKSDAPLNLWVTRKGYEIYYDFFRVKNLDTNSVELVFTVLLNIYKKIF